MTFTIDKNEKSDFIAFHIEDYVISNEFINTFYGDDFEKETAGEPTKEKWNIAIQFCNDLSRKHNLEPCYYIGNDPVDRANSNLKGISYECHFENNGWRLPTVEEIKKANFDYLNFEGYEWTTDSDNEFGEDNRIRLCIDEKLATRQGINKFYTSGYDSEEKYSFRLCRGIKANDPKEVPEDLITRRIQR